MSASNINSVTITGNLTRDPELRNLPSGTSVCDLRVAVNSSRKDQSGQWIDKPNYFDVTVFGGQAESCARYLGKGRPVAVQGRLDWSEWTTERNEKRSKVSIIADTVQFLGSPDGQQPAAGQQPQPQYQQPPAQPQPQPQPQPAPQPQYQQPPAQPQAAPQPQYQQPPAQPQAAPQPQFQAPAPQPQPMAPAGQMPPAPKPQPAQMPPAPVAAPGGPVASPDIPF
ncbi:MAG: single-stranded DNA-binding protein [Solirubrobacteraceae bacterium]|nr:single-stranded DNA-binding protein [Solirubrobacteraceae bacterium]